MSDKAEIPIPRNLDTEYYRVVRDGKYINLCFSDLTESEQDEIMEKYSAKQLRSLCRQICVSLRRIGDTLDLVVKYE